MRAPRHTFKGFSKKEIQDIIRAYTEKGESITKIASAYFVSKKRIKKLLKDNNIKIKKWIFTEEIKCKMRKKRNPEMSIKMYVVNAKYLPGFTNEYISSFNDLPKFGFLKTLLLRRLPQEYKNNELYLKSFIEKFYYDTSFNSIYKYWIENNKIKYLVPSIDHKTPLSRGGTWNLENLQILTWAENRAKYNFTQDEWEYIKNKYFKGEF